MNNKIKIESPEFRYCWVAFYKDKSILMQFDRDGTQHKFAEIKQSDLDLVKIYCRSNPFKEYILKFPQHADLIIFRRISKEVDFERNTGKQIGSSLKIEYYFGWKKLINSKSFKWFLVIDPDDNVWLKDDDGRGELDN